MLSQAAVVQGCRSYLVKEKVRLFFTKNALHSVSESMFVSRIAINEVLHSH